jgi:peptidoglycan/xylan/chitin deacetylase (PgdA/CDA1 family)
VLARAHLTRPWWVSRGAGAGLGSLVLPAVLLHSGASTGDRVSAAVAIAVAGLGAVATHGRTRVALAPLGALVVAAAAWLLTQAPLGVMTWWVALSLGLGLGIALPQQLSPARALLASTALAAITVVLARVAGGRGAALVVGAGWAVVSAGAASVLPRVSRSSARSSLTVASCAVVFFLGLAGWIGANSPSAGWFGSLVDHGSRHRREVALTFDDGPNITYTPSVRAILDRYGVKGTFFTVGKALDARPDISRALLDAGHLLGNHSYLHDDLRWLDPRYPELERTQRAFRRDLGVCPSFFRPPHGQHNPFMARVVQRHRMTMVTWDVSAGDFATHDAGLVARRVLDRVRPGAIIDLHDGIDGDLTADRSVLTRALPMILDGLRARGLRPVRLDVLLDRPGYGAAC